MAGISFILIVVVLVLLYSVHRKLTAIEQRMRMFDDRLSTNFELFYKELIKLKGSIKTDSTIEKPKEIPNQEIHEPKIEQKPIVHPIEEIIEHVAPPISTEKEQIKTIVQSIREKKVEVTTVKVNTPPSFMEKNPDLEKFIGENLLPKIGIAIFVIGMGFLVKLGIDNNIITEGMRIAIGVLCGAALISLAHYLRTMFSAFSSILIGGALAVLYYTMALAFHDYNILPQAVAFVIMVVITAFGVLLSIAYDRKELAVLAMLGGFGTPFFISTGEGNFVVLLTYILILDIGMLALVYFKKWDIINYITFVFTYILFAGVYSEKYLDNQDATRYTFLLYLTIFYFLFFLMALVYNIKNKHSFKMKEIGLILSNSAIYFGFGLGLLDGYKDGLYNGLFTSFIALFNFGFAITLYQRKEIDKNILYLLIGLVLTFVSLTAPIQLKGNYITLFWSLEAILLLWLSQKSGIKIMKLASSIINVLMLISLIMDWQQNYFESGEKYVVLSVIFNKVFLTSVVVTISLLSSFLLLKNEKEEAFFYELPTLKYKNILSIAFIAVLFLGMMLELNYQLLRAEFIASMRFIVLGIYYFTFLVGLAIFNHFKKDKQLKEFIFLISIPILFSYLSFYMFHIFKARNLITSNTQISPNGFYTHYILLALFVILIVHFYSHIHKYFTFKSNIGEFSLWVLAVAGVYIISIEISHISVLYLSKSIDNIPQINNKVIKTTLPIVWGISALILMLVGMRFKLKTLRIASLGLFLITILKLFLWDLKNNNTGKIVSFILLGVILLVVSFLYQKLKFIFQDDEHKK